MSESECRSDPVADAPHASPTPRLVGQMWPITSAELVAVFERIMEESPGRWFTADELIVQCPARQIFVRDNPPAPIAGEVLTNFIARPQRERQVGMAKQEGRWIFVVRRVPPKKAKQ